MRQSRFNLLLAATAAMVLLALAFLLISPTSEPEAVRERPAFPLLAEALGDAAVIEVVGADGGFRLTRSSAADLWLLPDRGGYPADGGTVAKLLSGLAGLRLFRAKTAKVENLTLLGLAGPGAGPGQGSRLIVRDAGGEPLVDAVIGKRTPDIAGEGIAGTYLRYSGSDQAWLATGQVRLPSSSLGMMDRHLLSLPASVIARVEVTPPGGVAGLVAERPARGLALRALSADGAVVSERALRRLAAGLERLDFRDVRPGEALPLPLPWRAGFTSFDGIHVTLTFQELPDGIWARIAAGAVPAVGQAEEAPPSDEVAAFAADLAARTDGWVFRLDPSVYLGLTAGIGETSLPAGN